MDMFAQIIGILAMACNVLSFQQNEQKKIIAMQFVGSVLFAVNMFMLGAVMGGLLNIVGIARAIVFMNKENIVKFKKIFVFIFILAYLVSYICTFTLFGKDINIFNLFVEFLPVTGMVVMTVAFSIDSAKITRRLGLINSPAWFTYNLINGSIGGTLSEAFSLVSIVTGIIRFDKKEKNNE